MITKTPTTPRELTRLLKQGEGFRLEFKRSTGELREGLQTICAFLNSQGGMVLFGVNRKGEVEGQQVSEQTIHEITAALARFEPPVVIGIERIKVQRGQSLIDSASAVRASLHRGHKSSSAQNSFRTIHSASLRWAGFEGRKSRGISWTTVRSTSTHSR